MLWAAHSFSSVSNRAPVLFRDVLLAHREADPPPAWGRLIGGKGCSFWHFRTCDLTVANETGMNARSLVGKFLLMRKWLLFFLGPVSGHLMTAWGESWHWGWQGRKTWGCLQSLPYISKHLLCEISMSWLFIPALRKLFCPLQLCPTWYHHKVRLGIRLKVSEVFLIPGFLSRI